VRPQAVQRICRQIFAAWGLPERIRVDRGHPWGSGSDLPPSLALWWLGLGIAVLWNRPRRPQQNGIVERVHGLVEAWAEPATCPDGASWVARLAWLEHTQREAYPRGGSPSRLAACPALTAGGRPYDPGTEPARWELGRVHAVLAAGVWVRRVSQTGQISLYDHDYSVGRAYARREVWVRLEAATAEWVIRAADDTELARHPAAELTSERIRSLTVTAPLPRRHNRVADRPP
jgi:hypothetical protein